MRGLFTANRFGKSYCAARECDAWASGKSPWFGRELPRPPVTIRVVGDGYDQGINQILIPIFQEIVDPDDLYQGGWDKAYAAGTHTLTYKNGSTVNFMSYRQADLGQGAQKFSGVALDLLWFDEHGSYRIWDECQARIGSRPMSSIVTLTPILGRTWEHSELYEPWQRGDAHIECFGGSIQDNPHLSTDAVARYLQRIRDPKMREVREHGVWIDIGGMVYDVWDASIHFIPTDPARIRAATKTVIIDPHPVKPEAVLWCGIDAGGGLFAYREHFSRKTYSDTADDIRRLSAEYDEQIRRYILDCHWGWSHKQDNKSVEQHYRDNKIPVEPSYRATKDNELFEPMRVMLNPPAIGKPMFEVMQSCERLKWEFEHNRFKPQSDSMRESDRWVRIKEDDDLLACAEYFVKSNPAYTGGKRHTVASRVLSATHEGMTA